MITLSQSPRSATAMLLEQAVSRSSLFSLDGLMERVFAHAFRNLVYPQIWEDPLVDLEALEITQDCHVVAIASGGCNIMSYLLADPARITAVDLNSAHIALLRLKLSAVRHLRSYDAFHRLFADAGDARNIEAYDTVLRPHLDWMARN